MNDTTKLIVREEDKKEVEELMKFFNSLTLSEKLKFKAFMQGVDFIKKIS